MMLATCYISGPHDKPRAVKLFNQVNHNNFQDNPAVVKLHFRIECFNSKKII